MITYILIALFFIVLLFKPTYWMTEVEDNEGNIGTVAACSALFYVIYLKIRFKDGIILLNGRQYDKVVEFYNEHI